MSLRVDRLREVREAHGWTQRELARLCGLGEAQIHRYENGITDPSATYLKLIADKLGVSSDYLLGLSDTPQGQLGESLKPDERRLLEAYTSGDGPTMLEIVGERLRQLSKTADAEKAANSP